jgi:hypothetical protein
MSSKKQLEAEIKTSGGTVITLRGAVDDISKVAALFASGSRQPGAEVISQTGGGAAPQASLEGIAEKDADGNINIVITDLKAKNAVDAAKRLIYVTLLARKRLLQEQKTDRATIAAALTNYGVNDGNARNLISKDKALIKDGRKNLSLSAGAAPTAAKYVQEIQDSSVVGKWSPGKTRKRRKSKKSASKSKP